MSARQIVCSIAAVLLLATLTSQAQTQLPAFVENKGQWPDQVHFRSELPGGVVWAENQALTFTVLGEGWAALGHDNPKQEINPDDYGIHHYKLHFRHSRIPAVAGKESGKSTHHYNYFVGNDPAHWAPKVHAYEQIRYTEIYDGIDLALYRKESGMKYDFFVDPGADPAQIEMEYEGLDQLRLLEGSLLIETSVRTITELKPFAYQMADGIMKEVECAFVVNENSVRFALGEYDPQLRLVIDPEIVFSTYIGSVASNFGFTATDDLDGNLIAGGCVFASGYPTTTGAVQDDFSFIVNSNCDVSISKFSADGSQLLYSTYLGGDGLEMPHSVIADSQGNYIVMGNTGSSNFPTTPGAYQNNLIGGPEFTFSTFFIQGNHDDGCDFFLTKFNANDGGIAASTYVGGSGNEGLNMADKLFYNYGDSFRGEVIVDQDDRIIVASTTYSSDFPMGAPAPQMTAGGNQDGIVFRMSGDLTNLEWASYVGGADADAAYSVQLDSNGALVITGGTKSNNLPMPDNAYQADLAGDVDAFVFRLSADASAWEAGSYIGTPQYDQCYFVQIDQDDQIYLIGQTEGEMPILGDVHSNPGSGQFLLKLDHDLSTLQWQTTIGTGSGAIDISPTAFLVSDCDQIYFSGWGGITNVQSSPYAEQSTTSGLPITPDAFQSTTDGSDFYLCVLESDASALSYATFFGGDQSREHVDGGTSKFDKDGSVYQAVCAGCGGYDDFPSTPDAWSATNPSTNCNLGVFKFDLANLTASIGIDGPETLCQGESVEFMNESFGADTFLWEFGDGATSTEAFPSHSYAEPGDYVVTMFASSSNDCMEPAMDFMNVTVLEGVSLSVEAVPPICEGSSVQLNASGSNNILWLENPELSALDIPNPVATPSGPLTTYFVTDTGECGGDTLAVEVSWSNVEINLPEAPELCVGQSATLNVSGGSSYLWEPSTYLNNATSNAPVVTPLSDVTYTVTAISAEGCEASADLTVTVYEDAPGGSLYPEVMACEGEATLLTAADGNAWLWSPAELLNNPAIQQPLVTLSEATLFTVEVTNACGSGTDSVWVFPVIPQGFANPIDRVCKGATFTLSAGGGESYYWSPPIFLDHPDSASTTGAIAADQVFTAYITDENGCTAAVEVPVGVWPLPYVEAGPDRILEWLESDYLFGSADGETYWWEPPTDLNCADCLTPTVSPDESRWYHLYTVDANGCRNLDSVYVDVFNPIYVPNTFTPNNDGINDLFLARGVNIRGFRMEIRNRWGELIFVSEDINKGWNGAVKEGEHYAQIDTYLWTVYYDSKDGRQKRTGHVTLIR